MLSLCSKSSGMEAKAWESPVVREEGTQEQCRCWGGRWRTCQVEGGGLGDTRLDGYWKTIPLVVSSLPSFSENSPAALKARVCCLGACGLLPHASALHGPLLHASLLVANSLTLVEPFLGTLHFSTLCRGEKWAKSGPTQPQPEICNCQVRLEADWRAFTKPSLQGVWISLRGEKQELRLPPHSSCREGHPGPNLGPDLVLHL